METQTKADINNRIVSIEKGINKLNNQIDYIMNNMKDDILYSDGSKVNEYIAEIKDYQEVIDQRIGWVKELEVQLDAVK